eukprot:g14475.t1
MKRRGGSGGGGHGAAGGASRRDGGSHDRDGEGKLRIHLKRSCTDRKVVPPADTGLGLTTDDWQKFKRLLATKTFAVHDTRRIRGEDMTAAWAEESGFREPVIASDKTGMGLKVPDTSFTVADVARVVGEDKLIRPIHVGEQANIDQSMTLAEFAEYFEMCTKPGQAILNMISLEFSDTPLAKMVQSPQLVREIDWLNQCWPEHRKEEGQFPKVQYYCLMSQGGSYTDFHVDFGGTSVWYHILRGKKEFLLIRPTEKNLELYEGWIRSPTQSQVFFGDLADTCYRVVLNAGETMMIPSGWIHAVFTPKPSLVFGGNFLHSLNIRMQLQIHAIEVRAKTAAKFRFPYFKEMMLFAASKYLQALRAEQGEPDVMRVTQEVGAGKNNTTNAPEETLEGGGGGGGGSKATSEEQKQEGERGQSTKAGNGEAAAPSAHPNGGGCGRRDGAPLGSWEREGLRPLLEACRAWIQEEVEDGDENGVPEEWHLAATMAGCADVSEMLEELGYRISALEEIASNTTATAATTTATTVSTTQLDGGDVGDSGDVRHTGAVVASAVTGKGNGGEGEDAEQQSDPGSAAAAGAAALLLAAAAAETLGEDDGGAGETALESLQGPGLNAIKPSGKDGASTNPEGSSSSSSSYSIPKLKISVKSPPPPPPPQQQQQQQHQQQSPSHRALGGGGAMAGADEGDNPAVGSRRAGLKLVLKGPALSSSGSGASARVGGSAGVAGRRESPAGGGGAGGAGKKRGRQQPPKQRQRQERRWKEDYEDSDEFAAADSSDDDEEEDEDEEEEEEEEEEEDSGDETRIGRGGKRKARPLGSRLRAIARLGDDAAGGGSEDDNSADEYKPDEADDVLPEDHKIYADELPRETKKGKSASSGGGRSNDSGGRSTNTWSGFGSSAGGGAGVRGSGSGGAAGGRGKGTAVVAGVRRLNVTKQEALRSKGLFKIAPPSKVPPKPRSKEKKPLTAKQKLLAKMRR